MKSIGIDIGSSSIKVAIVKAEGVGYKIKEFFEIPLPTDPKVDSYIHKIDALKNIADRYPDSEYRYCVALPQEKVIARRLSFPFKQRSKILKSIAFELEDEIPFDHEDAIFDLKIIETHENGAEVLAFVSPKEYVEETLEMFKDVGIDPEVISCEGNTLANLFENWYQAPPSVSKITFNEDEPEEDEETTHRPVSEFKHPELIIAMGHQTSIFCLMDDKKLHSVRSVPFGSEQIIKNLQEKYKISYSEAFQTLKEKSFILLDYSNADQDQITFSNTIGTVFDDFINDIKRHLLSIEPKLVHDLKAIWLTGGLAQLMNLHPYITQGFHISTNLLRHFNRAYSASIEQSKENELKSSVAVGLAIEGIRLARNPAINFRKDEFSRQTQRWQQFKQKWGYAATMAAAAFLIICTYGILKNAVSDNLEQEARKAYRKQGKSLGLANSQLTPSKVRSYIRDELKNINVKKQLVELNKMNSPLDIIEKLSGIFPNQQKLSVDIKSLNVQYEFLDIEGYANNISALEQTLKSFSLDGNLKKQKSKLTNLPGKRAFSYSLIIDRGVTKQ